MPYKFETSKLLIAKEDDKRIKLDDSDKRLIVELYKTGEYSQRKLAVQFGVSRRLITFILDPSKLAKNIENRKGRGGSKQYYDTYKNTNAMRKWRQNKMELYKEGKLQWRY